MEYKNDFDKFLLKVDISGIQNFIFDIPSDGASKSIKGRSFYVYSLTHFAETFFSQLFVNEIIYNGGGNLLMYISANEEDLKKKINEFQNCFIEKELYPFIVYVKAANNDFEMQNKQLGKLINIEKLKRKLIFKPFEPCTENIDWNEVSKRLKKSKGFTICEMNESNIISVGNLSLTFINDDNAKITFENKLLNKFPTNNEEETIDFDEIAKKALLRKADEKLAALKIDVDNLGNLFMNKNKDDYRKISQAIENFFSVTLYTEILKIYIENGDVYPVFAGGDDAFIIGAWDKIFEIAGIIHSSFDNIQKTWRKNIIQKEDDITISAGLVVVNSKFPMIRLANEVEDMLDLAKKEGKNRIGIFDECITWSEFERDSKLVKYLVDLISNNEESKSLLYRIRSSEIGFRSLQDKIRERNRIDFPKVYRLKYFLRNAKNEKNKEVIKKIFDEYSDAILNDFLVTKNNDKKNKFTNPAIFPIAARWAELLIKNIETPKV